MRWLCAVMVVLAGMVQAAPEETLRPVSRGDAGLMLDASGAIARRTARPPLQTGSLRGDGLAQSRRPEMRPRGIEKTAQAQQRARVQGAVCGDPDIQGAPLGRIDGARAGCGVPDAVRVRTISGVALSQRSTMDCPTAQALKTWIDTSVKPAIGRKGGGLKRLRVAAHYVCRTRNSRPGARISEHGKGRAIDISALRLNDGTLITVQNGWNDASTGAILRKVHADACGPFSTVLGPDADRYHRDHFHFDTARYRNGSYCR